MSTRPLFVLTLLTLCLIVGVPRAQAAFFTVNTTSDLPDSNPADNVCQTSAGTCSLRAAIETTNVFAGEDTIAFDPTIFVPGTVITVIGTALPQITESVTIAHPHPANVIIDGGLTRRAGFNIGAGVVVSLSGLTLRNGLGLNGGTIYNAGTVIATRLIMSGSSATQYGGAIANVGTLTLSDSLLFSNAAVLGGGIYSEGTMTLTNVTLTDNDATDGGGGILTNNSTISTLRQVTITGNQAQTGGGIDVRGTFSMGNTLIAGNTATVNFPDVYGDVVSLGNNLIGNSDGANVSGDTIGNLLDAAAQPLNLGPLADNGGYTRTHVLSLGSVAINAGRNSLAVQPGGAALIYDQRGDPLTGVFPRIIGAAVDVGAYEAPGLGLRTISEGRTQPAPHPSHRIQAIVRIIRTSDGMSVFNQAMESDDSGVLTVFGLPAGNYRVAVKGSHTLARAIDLTMPAVQATPEVNFPMLLEGDSSDDNVVSVADFSILAASFGRASGQAEFDARADFNQDGVVTITDFSLLAGNFGKGGEAP